MMNRGRLRRRNSVTLFCRGGPSLCLSVCMYRTFVRGPKSHTPLGLAHLKDTAFEEMLHYSLKLHRHRRRCCQIGAHFCEAADTAQAASLPAGSEAATLIGRAAAGATPQLLPRRAALRPKCL